MTPAQAMLWQIWRGWWGGLVLGWAYLLLAAVVVRLLPGLLEQTSPGIAALPEAGRVLSLPGGFIIIHLLSAFTVGGGELTDTGYSRRMFVLPVTTRTLVAWPMIWGSVAVGCVWLLIAGLILRPTGLAAPLWWPGAALAVGLTIMQCASWLPLAQGWLRAVFVLPALMSLVGVALLLSFSEFPEWLATGLLLCCLPLTYATTLWGVALARRGDALEWRLWERLVARSANWRKPAEHPFSSFARAQLWFECRCFAWSLPLFVALLAVFLAALVLAERGCEVTEAWKLLATVLLMPAGLATILGGPLGKPSFPFTATRPVSSVDMVRSKLQMAFLSALAAHIPMLFVVPLFLFWPDLFGYVLQGARSAGPLKATAILVLVVVLPVLLTWKGLVENMWLGLAGRPWLMNAVSFCLPLVIGSGISLGLACWLYPELQALVWSLLPWFIGLLLVAKLIAAAWVLSALVRAQLVRHIAAATMLAVWGLVVLELWLLVSWLIPGQLLSKGSALAAVVLFIPFSRLAGAPLALEWNRHR